MSTEPAGETLEQAEAPRQPQPELFQKAAPPRPVGESIDIPFPDPASSGETLSSLLTNPDGPDPGDDPLAHDPSGFDPSARDTSLRLVAERPIKSPSEDLLGYQPFAEAISSILVDSRTDTPLTICVSGPWGAGKTSLVNLVCSNLEEAARRTDTSPLILEFNAWHHEAADNLGNALAASVARDLNKSRGIVRRAISPVPPSMLDQRTLLLRRGLRFLAFVAAVLGLVWWLYGIGSAAGVDTALGADTGLGVDVLSGVPLALVLGLWVWGHLNSLNQTLGAFFRSPKNEADRGTMAEVRKQLHQLIGHVVDGPLGHSPVIIVIDDLDRVPPTTAIEVCETVTQLLDRTGIVVILVADILTLEAAAEAKYREAAESYRLRPGTAGAGRYLPESYGRAFMQKLVHFQVGLPPATSEQLRAVASSHVSSRPEPKAAGGNGRTRRRAILGRLRSRSKPAFPTFGYGAARRWVDNLGAVFHGVMAAVLAAMGLLLLAVTATTDGSNAAGWAAPGVLFAFSARGVYRANSEAKEVGRLHTARHAARRSADRLIGQAVGANPVGTRIDTAAILEQLGIELITSHGPAVTDKVMAELKPSIDEIVAELVAVDSVARRQAENEITAYFLPLPRGVKRLVNQLRFLLYVAQRNNLLDPVDVTPERVGKWAVLGERWPDLSAAIEQEPALLDELERLSAEPGGAFNRRMESFKIPGLCADPALQEFLRSGEQLGSVAPQLTYLRRSEPEFAI